jgi:hypothetical protein
VAGHIHDCTVWVQCRDGGMSSVQEYISCLFGSAEKGDPGGL